MIQSALSRSLVVARPEDRAEGDAAPMAAVETIATFDGRSLSLDVTADPVVDLGRLATAGCLMTPRLTDERTGLPLTQADRLTLLASDTERVDVAAFDRALMRLEAARTQGEIVSLIVPVSFLTASSLRARTNLLLRPGPLKGAVRASVIWLLRDLPDGVPAGRLTEVASLLRPFGRAVFAETRLTGVALKAAKTAGIAGLVLKPQKIGLSDTDTALWLLHVGRMAAKAAPALIAANLRSSDLFAMAGEAGFTHATVAAGQLTA